MLLTPLQTNLGVLAGRTYYLILSGFLGFPLLAFWLILAVFLGRSFQKAITEKRVICYGNFEIKPIRVKLIIKIFRIERIA